jgi:hypothetical protein
MLCRTIRANGGGRTSRAGDVAENPVTGERVVAEIFVRLGGAVAGEHVHPGIDEWFTVL